MGLASTILASELKFTDYHDSEVLILTGVAVDTAVRPGFCIVVLRRTII